MATAQDHYINHIFPDGNYSLQCIIPSCDFKYPADVSAEDLASHYLSHCPDNLWVRVCDYPNCLHAFKLTDTVEVTTAHARSHTKEAYESGDRPALTPDKIIVQFCRNDLQIIRTAADRRLHRHHLRGWNLKDYPTATLKDVLDTRQIFDDRMDQEIKKDWDIKDLLIYAGWDEEPRTLEDSSSD